MRPVPGGIPDGRSKGTKRRNKHHLGSDGEEYSPTESEGSDTESVLDDDDVEELSSDDSSEDGEETSSEEDEEEAAAAATDTEGLEMEEGELGLGEKKKKKKKEPSHSGIASKSSAAVKKTRGPRGKVTKPAPAAVGGSASAMHRSFDRERAKIEKSLAAGKLDPKTARALTAKLQESFSSGSSKVVKKRKKEEGKKQAAPKEGGEVGRKSKKAQSADETGRGMDKRKRAKREPAEEEEEEGEEAPPVKRQVGVPERVVSLSSNRVLRSTYPNLFFRLNTLWSVFTSTLVLKNNSGIMESVTIERRPPPESKKKAVNISFKIRDVHKWIEALKTIISEAKPPAPVTCESILALPTDDTGWRTLGPSGFTQYPHTLVVVEGTWIETREVEWQTKGGGSMEALSIIRKESLNTGLKKDFSLDLPVYLTPALLGCIEAIEKQCFRGRGEAE